MLVTRDQLGYLLTDVSARLRAGRRAGARRHARDRAPARPVMTSRTTCGRIVGDQHVLTDAGLTASYETDWTRRFHGRARCVVRPGSTDEVAAVLRACAEAGAAVVPQGGNTGLVGGGVPADGEVLLSLRPADRARTRSTPRPAQVTVGAGVTVAALQQHARAAGLDFGVDLAARDSAHDRRPGRDQRRRRCTCCATAACAQQVLGVEAVLADGSVVRRLGGLRQGQHRLRPGRAARRQRGHAGRHHRGPAAAVCRCSPARAWRWSPSTDAAARRWPLARGSRRCLTTLEAAELFLADGLALVRGARRPAGPVRRGDPRPTCCSSARTATDPTDGCSPRCSARAAPGRATSRSPRTRPGRERLWRYREAHTEAINAAGVPVKLDVAVPPGRWPSSVAELPRTVVRRSSPSARTDRLRPPQRGQPARQRARRRRPRDGGQRRGADAGRVRSAAASAPSTASGGPRPRWLALSRSPAEIAAMRADQGGARPGRAAQPRRPLRPLSRRRAQPCWASPTT